MKKSKVSEKRYMVNYKFFFIDSISFPWFVPGGGGGGEKHI